MYNKIYKNNDHNLFLNILTLTTVTMRKVVPAFSFFCLVGHILAITVDPYYRHVITSPNSASEAFYTGSERKVLAPAPVVETSVVPAAAPAAPIAAIAPAPSVAAPASLVLGAPAAVMIPVAPVDSVVAKVAQFKLSYPQYAYGYSVQDFTTGDNKLAKEVREGGIVKGSYSVADPDGTKRTVNYYADPVHGFNAVVHKTQIL